MTEARGASDITSRRVLFAHGEAERVQVVRDLAFPGYDGAPLAFDLYRAPDAPPGARCPAVVILSGYPDEGFRRVVGCRFKEMGSSVSWATQIAQSGIAAITYTNREPAADAEALVGYLRDRSADFGLDAARLAVWASSGNVPLALWLVSRDRDRDAVEALRCGAFCYGYTMDLGGDTAVADAAALFRFANPGHGLTAGDLPMNVPLLIVRAGKDEMPRLNESLDRFMAAALAARLPVSLHNVPSAPHAFDLVSDTPDTRWAIALVLDFLRLHLLEAGS